MTRPLIAAALVTALLIAGCGSDEPPTTDTSAAATTSTPTAIPDITWPGETPAIQSCQAAIRLYVTSRTPGVTGVSWFSGSAIVIDHATVSVTGMVQTAVGSKLTLAQYRCTVQFTAPATYIVTSTTVL